MARPSSLPLATPEIETAATAADVSARTVRRYLAGVSVSASTMRRVERALRGLGLEAAIRPIPAASDAA